jgi:hypothetical protein
MASYINASALPAVIEPKKEIVEIDDCIASKKIIILYTKALSADDVEIISRYGKVLRYNYSLINIKWNQLVCDYLLVDATDKTALYNVEQHLSDPDISVCHYGSFYEENAFDDDINFVSKIRPCAYKAEFDASLLNKKKLKKPSKLINCASYLVNFLVNLKK